MAAKSPSIVAIVPTPLVKTIYNLIVHTIIKKLRNLFKLFPFSLFYNRATHMSMFPLLQLFNNSPYKRRFLKETYREEYRAVRFFTLIVNKRFDFFFLFF